MPFLRVPRVGRGGRAWLDEDVVREIVAETAEWWPLETGGMLVGYAADGLARDLVITDVIGPGPDAVHKKSRFEPDTVWQQVELERLYFESERTWTYLGDWHSHPNGGCYLSFTDWTTLLRISLHRDARARRPAMLVSAGTEDTTDVRIALFQLQGVRLVELELVVWERRPTQSALRKR